MGMGMCKFCSWEWEREWEWQRGNGREWDKGFLANFHKCTVK